MEKAAHHKSDGNIENFQHEEKHEENGDKDSYDLAGNRSRIEGAVNECKWIYNAKKEWHILSRC